MCGGAAGPSGGCAIITSLLSLALGRPVLPDLAMTGAALHLPTLLSLHAPSVHQVALRFMPLSILDIAVLLFHDQCMYAFCAKSICLMHMLCIWDELSAKLGEG